QPNHAEANHQLGVLLAQQSKLDDALMQLEWAVQQAPQQEQYWVSYIDALMLLGEYAQADSAIGLGEEFGLTAETAQMLRVELAPQLEAQPQASIKTKAHSDKPVATICTLIPAYKPNYIEQLLLSLATQTYPHFKVVISDDNPNDEVTALVQRLAQLDIYKKLDISVVPGPKKGGFVNIYHVARSYAQEAEFFHILMDDDLIYPTFYETHMREHAKQEALISVSARWNALETGQPFGMLIDHATSQVFSQHFDAATMANALIPGCSNKLGEFSHAVFRREAAEVILNPSMQGISYFGLDDIGSFIQAAQHKPAIWIPTPLGIFRNNPEQNTGKLNNNTIKCGHYAWIALAIIAVENRWISADEAWASISMMRNAVRVRYQQDALGQQMLAVLDAHEVYSEALKQSFLAVWNTYLTQLNIEKIVAGDLSIQIL
ncbi:MAG: glycosyltransferase family A protein, partial [Nitrosomonas sp.]